MTNIEIAKKNLREKNNKLIVVKNCEIVFLSNKNGIVPMYDLFNSNVEGEVFIADKFIGLGAARLLLNSNFKVGELFAEVASKTAIELIEKANVKMTFENKVEKILNRTGEDLCPVEKLSLNNKDFKDFHSKLKSFLEKTNQI